MHQVSLCAGPAALVFGDFDYRQLGSDAYYVLAADFVTAATKSLRGAVLAGGGRQMTFLSVQPFGKIEGSELSDVIFVYDAQFCSELVKSRLSNVILHGPTVADSIKTSELVGVASERFAVQTLANTSLRFVDFGEFAVFSVDRVLIASGVLHNLLIYSVSGLDGVDLLLPPSAAFASCANCLPEDYLQDFVRNCQNCRLFEGIVRFTTVVEASQAPTRLLSTHLAVSSFECLYFSSDGCLEFCGLPGPVCGNRGACVAFACQCDAGWDPSANCLAAAPKAQANSANAALAFLTAIFVCGSFLCFGLTIYMRIAAARQAKHAAAERSRGRCAEPQE